jgi:hypothetical protein
MLIRKLNRKTIPLPSLTTAAREAGALEEGQSIEAVIRRVRTMEVASQTGVPPQIFQLELDRQPGESREEQRARLQRAIRENADITNESIKMNERQARIIVHLGTTKIIVPGEGEYEVTLEDTLDETTIGPSDLGDDFGRLHNEILRFSGLDYAPIPETGVQEGAGMTAFPEERLADRPESNGGTVRHDASETPG